VSSFDDTLPPGGPMLQRAFEALVETFNQRGIRYAIIGGLATMQHSRVRTTDDIDALLTVTQIAMPGLFEALAERGFAVDLVRNIQEFRDEGMTTIRFGEVIVDLLKPVIPAYAHVLDRAINAEMFGQQVRVSSPEGLIVTKLIAMRPQDESDVRDLLNGYGKSLDLDFIHAELQTFCDENDPRQTKFDNWVQEAMGGPESR